MRNSDAAILVQNLLVILPFLPEIKWKEKNFLSNSLPPYAFGALEYIFEIESGPVNFRISNLS